MARCGRGKQWRVAVKVGCLVVALCLILPFINSLPYTPRDLLNRDEPFSVPLRILPLGDSITWGVQPKAPPEGTNGYRKQLRDRLTSSGAQVNLVGTQHSGNMTDDENEGHPGYTISQLQGVMGPGLDLKPNVILLHIGTNDMNYDESHAGAGPYSEAPDRLGTLLDVIIEACPDALLMVAKIIQSKKEGTELRIQTYDEAVPDVVKERADQGHKVIVADLSTVQPDELADDLHPSDAGYIHMGNIWFDAVKAAAQQDLISAPT